MSAAEQKERAIGELVLAHASGRPERLAGLNCGGNPIRYIFLGRDFLAQEGWDEALGPAFQRVRIGQSLKLTASRLRRPFLDLMTDLSLRYSSLAWWTSRVSERNTTVSPLFLHCCYLHVGLDEIARTQQRLCIICESWAVLHSLEEAAHGCNRPVRWATPSLPAWRVSLTRCARLAQRAWAFLRTRTAILRIAKKLDTEPSKAGTPSGRPRVLLQTWVDEACLQEDQAFQDRHLPGLCALFEQKGCDVWTLPVLQNMERSYAATWRHLRRCRESFLDPNEYYRFADVLYACCVGLRQALVPSGRIRLGNLNATRLFAEDRLRFAFDPGALDCILASRLPKRLKQCGFEIDLLLHTFENTILEKGTIWGFRREMPRTRIVGFQNSTLPPLILSLFPTSGEAAVAPLPDRIVCNGPFFRDLLIREGLDPDRVVEGAALRFAHLWTQASAGDEEADARTCVLVALPLEASLAAEVLVKVHQALGEAAELPVKIKPHPMMQVEALAQRCGIAVWPGHFEWVDGAIQDWLRRARVVVSSGSAVLDEAMIDGVPVVTVGRDCGLDLNSWDGLGDTPPICHTAQEIRAETLRLWRLTPTAREELRRRGRALLRRCFNPVTEDRMQAFVAGLLPGLGHDGEDRTGEPGRDPLMPFPNRVDNIDGQMIQIPPTRGTPRERSAPEQTHRQHHRSVLQPAGTSRAMPGQDPREREPRS